MAHIHIIEDKNGDAVDQLVFCSDFCHQDYCLPKGTYRGWYGCIEISFNEPCANCNNLVQGILNFADLDQTLEEFEQAKIKWESENTVTQRIYP
jgi:hypothetical protein